MGWFSHAAEPVTLVTTSSAATAQSEAAWYPGIIVDNQLGFSEQAEFVISKEENKT